MTHSREPTTIIFPRISSRDGPARTVYKDSIRDGNFQADNPLYNTYIHGFSEDVVIMLKNKPVLKTLRHPNTATMLNRTSQRFRGNSKRPDSATQDLINRRRR